MRGILLEHHPRITALFTAAFAYADMSLVRVPSLAALLAAVEMAQTNDFAILDLTLVVPCEVTRYTAVLRQDAVPVHIVYRDEALLVPLLALGGAPLMLMAADISWFVLLDKLEALQRLVYAARVAALPAGQHKVLHLLGEGRSRAGVAEHLGIGVGTAKEHSDRLKRALGVDTLAELRGIARLEDSWVSHPGGGHARPDGRRTHAPEYAPVAGAASRLQGVQLGSG